MSKPHPMVGVGDYIQDHYDSLTPEEKARLDAIYRDVREMCREYESHSGIRNGRMYYTVTKKATDETTL